MLIHMDRSQQRKGIISIKMSYTRATDEARQAREEAHQIRCSSRAKATIHPEGLSAELNMLFNCAVLTSVDRSQEHEGIITMTMSYTGTTDETRRAREAALKNEMEARSSTPQQSTIRDHTGSGVGNNPDDHKDDYKETKQIKVRVFLLRHLKRPGSIACSLSCMTTLSGNHSRDSCLTAGQGMRMGLIMHRQ